MGSLRSSSILQSGPGCFRLWRFLLREFPTLKTSMLRAPTRIPLPRRYASGVRAGLVLLCLVFSVTRVARSSDPVEDSGAMTVLGSGTLEANGGMRGEYSWVGWTDPSSAIHTWWVLETFTVWEVTDTSPTKTARFMRIDARVGVELLEQHDRAGASVRAVGFGLHRDGGMLCVRNSGGSERSRTHAESGTAVSIALAELFGSVPRFAELARVPRTFDPESGALLLKPLLGPGGAFQRQGEARLISTTSARGMAFVSHGVRRGPAKDWRSRPRDGELGLAAEFFIAVASGDRTGLESIVDFESVLETSDARECGFADRGTMISYLSNAYRSRELLKTGGNEWSWGGVLLLPGGVHRRDDGWIMVSDTVGVRTGFPSDPRIKAIRWFVEILVDPSVPARYPDNAAIRFRIALQLADRKLLESLTRFDSLSLDHGPRGQFARDALLNTWTSAPSIQHDWTQILGTYNALAKSQETTFVGVARASVRFRSDSPGFLYDFERLDGAWRLVGVHRDNPPK